MAKYLLQTIAVIGEGQYRTTQFQSLPLPTLPCKTLCMCIVLCFSQLKKMPS